MSLPNVRLPVALLAVAALVLPAAAQAREESKIQITLENLVGGGRFDESGTVRTHMDDGARGTVARLDLHAKRLVADAEYILMSDGTEIGRLTADGRGNGKLQLDLLAENVDPRGTFVSVNDGTQDVLGAWLYGAAADDPPRAKVKEGTELAADETAAPSGQVQATYMLLPNGMARFGVALRGLERGDYDICVDGDVKATLTTNAGGAARAEFKTLPQVGNGRRRGNAGIGGGPAHNQRKRLDIDPRDALIEVKMAGDPAVLFSGPMRAQIGTLGSCTPESTTTAMALDDGAQAGQAGATGDATTGIEESCDATFEVDLAMLLPGDYDLHVDGALIDTTTVTDDSSGTGAAALLYDENPDSGEMLLDFVVGPGSVVEIFDVTAGGVVLSTTLPPLP